MYGNGLLILCSLASVISLFGFVGNTLVFVGFQNTAPGTSTSILFQALAVADNFVLVTTIPVQWTKFISFFVLRPDHARILHLLEAYIQTYIHPISNMSILWSICITILLAVTRFIAVYFPLHASRLCSIPRIRICLGAITLFSIAYNLPAYYVFTFMLSSSSNETYVTFYIRSFKMMKFMEYTRTALYAIIPLVLITTITTLLIIKLRKLEKRRRHLTSRQQRNNNATRLLVAVLIVFLLCSLPFPLCILIMKSTNTYFSLRLVQFLYCLTDVLYNVNSSVNFLIYTIFSKEYRKVITKSVKWFFCRHGNVNILHEQGRCAQILPEVVHQMTTRV